MEYHQLQVGKGQEVVLADLRGPGKVTYFYITDDTQVHWYRGLVLKVYWDDEAEPSIQTPLSDFFGAIGGKTIDYQSVPMQINHACYMCYLPMPFAKRARFIVANDGDAPYSKNVAYGIDYEQGASFAQEKSRLHCAWRRSNPVKDGLHTILEARGRGHYVGNSHGRQHRLCQLLAFGCCWLLGRALQALESHCGLMGCGDKLPPQEHEIAETTLQTSTKRLPQKTGTNSRPRIIGGCENWQDGWTRTTIRSSGTLSGAHGIFWRTQLILKPTSLT